jgi:tetratricopeptide (TPR) repeat protein
MNETSEERRIVFAKIGTAVDLTKEAKYAEALEVFEELLPTLSSRDVAEKRVLSNSSSFYGLCVAMVKRRYAEAVKYCNISLKGNFMDPDHHTNLALVYLERDDRENAVKNLHAGLKIQRNNKRIQQILHKIGSRSPPVITFLSRNNPLNVWFGKRRALKLRQQKS